MKTTSVIVTAKTNLTALELATVIEKLIEAGQADAEATIEDGDNFDENSVAEATVAASIEITEVTPNARALVHVSNGVADVECDRGVAVAIYDFDEPSGTVPYAFKDLAETIGAPVEPKQSCGNCAKCSCPSK